MKKSIFAALLCFALTLGLLLNLPVPARAASPDTLKIGLEKDGFTVQQGKYYELDTLEMASQGKLLSCFGNNAGSGYMVLELPEAPGQTVPNPTFPPAGWQYKLRADEALVLITPLPPECTYYSFIHYVMFTEQKDGKDYSQQRGYFSAGNDEVGLYHPIFGSIGDPVNMQNIRHDGSGAFGTNAVIVLSANQAVTRRVVAQLTAAGYPESMINILPIPENTYHMGLEKGADTFCLLGRVSQPKDDQAYQDYIAALAEKSTVYRVTPETELPSAPYENPTVTPRGTGVHETALLDQAPEHLDQIRAALLEQYGKDYTYEELRTDIAVPEGLTAYYNDCNAQGDNRDTTYLMTKDFTLDSDEDFIVVYGVNHQATGKAVYANAILYGRPMLNGACSVYDSLFPGSAKDYLEANCDTQDKYYVYKIARTALDDHTAILPYSTGNTQGKFYGLDNGNPMLLAFRAYLDQNGVGPSYYEIIYERAIVFHKK